MRFKLMTTMQPWEKASHWSKTYFSSATLTYFLLIVGKYGWKAIGNYTICCFSITDSGHNLWCHITYKQQRFTRAPWAMVLTSIALDCLRLPSRSKVQSIAVPSSLMKRQPPSKPSVYPVATRVSPSRRIPRMPPLPEWSGEQKGVSEVFIRKFVSSVFEGSTTSE